MDFQEFWWALEEKERFDFIEENYPIRNAEGDLVQNWQFTDKQKEWYCNGPLFIKNKSELINRIMVKSRNAGATKICIALEALLGVQIYPHTFVPIAAGPEDQAMLSMKNVRGLIEDCSYTIELKKPLNQQAESCIEFREGASIKSFPGNNPEGLHGPRALFGYLDEFALSKYQSRLLRAFNYFFSEGGQLSLLSTFHGKNNDFWDISQNFKAYGYKRFDIMLFKDMEHFDITRPLHEQLHLGLESPWLNIDKLERDRIKDAVNNYADFRQQMCGDPLEEITQFFPDELTHNPPVLNKELLPCEQPQANDVWVGALDVAAQKVNQTALVDGQVLFSEKSRKLSVRNVEIITGEYTIQKNKVIAKAKTMGYKYFAPDETGMGGINWVSELRKECGNTIVRGITYGGKDWCDDNIKTNNKELMFEISKKLMQDGLVEIPDNSMLLEQLSRVEKTIRSSSGNAIPSYSGKQGGKYDDDVVCAFCQLCLLFYVYFVKNQPLTVSIKGMQTYPRASITRGTRYSGKMRFL